MTTNMRDLHADLAICEDASAGEWTIADTTDGYYILDASDWVVGATIENVHDARFIAESRQGWPEAIRRAIAAEASLDKLVRAYVVQDNSRYGVDDFWDVVDSIVNKAAEERVKQGLRLCTECGSDYPPETSVYSNMCKTCADESDMPAGYWDYDTDDFHYENEEVD